MKEVNYDKDIKALFVILVALVLLLGYVTFIKLTYKAPTENNGGKDVEVSDNDDFRLNFIKNTNKVNSDNYLISPYSVEIALDMLRNGADESTLEELNSVLGSRSIANISVKDRIGVANSLFIKDVFKDYVKSEFSDYAMNTYGAEIIYDSFSSPDIINEWCQEKTWNMIDKVVDDMSSDFVLGIANAVAIDVDWFAEFNCHETESAEFSKDDGTVINVEMMHNEYKNTVKYFEDDNSMGVVIPYMTYDADGNINGGGTKLEFVGILPNDTVSEYITNLNSDVLEGIDNAEEASGSQKISVFLPRFKYDYDFDQFGSVLKTMGINNVFDSTSANLTNIISRDDMTSLGIENLYVSTAIHKTHIDLNEKGTKAAAITYIQEEYENAMMDGDNEIIELKFDRPFVYMIRDSQSKEILFFGVVYSPSEWSGSTCSD